MKVILKRPLLFYVIFLTFLFQNVYGFALNDKDKIFEIFNKTKNFYNVSQFQIKTDYKLYIGNTSKEVRENYSGVFVKNKNNVYSKIGQTEFVTIDNKNIKIDNESKLMQISEKRSEQDEVYDLSKYCSNFSTFVLTTTNDLFICTLTTPEVTFVPYSKVVIYINKSDCSIKKQVLFMIGKVRYKADNEKVIKDYPRLEISFLDLKLQYSKEEYFNLGKYIEKKKGKYFPAKKYVSYKIVD